MLIVIFSGKSALCDDNTHGQSEPLFGQSEPVPTELIIIAKIMNRVEDRPNLSSHFPACQSARHAGREEWPDI